MTAVNGVRYSRKADDEESTRVASADSLMTWDRDGAVKLRLADSGPGAEPPQTIMQAFKRTVDRAPNRMALAAKIDGSWKGFTFKNYYEQVQCAARAFIKLGLEPRYGVGIMGFNSHEWFIANIGAITAGGIATGIYTTNSPEACHYVLDNASCQIAVVENELQLNKILQVRDRLPNLKTIVQYKGTPPSDGPAADVLSWNGLMAYGEEKDEEVEDELSKRISAQCANHCSSLIYTSGTTGNPKGVMLSHDNMIWTAKMIVRFTQISLDTEMTVSYLPLSHIAAQLLDMYIPIISGATVHFAQPDALKGSLKTTLQEVRPTVFLGVPRVWEKFQEGIVAASRSSGGMKRKIGAWARDVGYRSNMAVLRGQPKLLCYKVAKKLVFDKVRVALGLDRCRFLVSGAAPITRETLEFFLSLDMPLLEVYGMSESSAPHTMNLPWNYCLSSVGADLPGVTTKLVDVDKNVTGEGEICMFGRHVFMGYLNNPEKTKEAMDEEGWLHSGDIGKKNKDGHLFITGRIKELLITAGGENIPPVPIEDKVKETLPCISNCMLIGDKRKFLSMLLTLKTEVNAETQEPTERLTGPAVDWCRSVGSTATTVVDIIDDHNQQVLEAVQKGIDAVNRQATSNAQRIQKWSILRKDFTIAGGELGPTLKLKRPDVMKLYATTIDTFYDEGTDNRAMS